MQAPAMQHLHKRLYTNIQCASPAFFARPPHQCASQCAPLPLRHQNPGCAPHVACRAAQDNGSSPPEPDSAAATNTNLVQRALTGSDKVDWTTFLSTLAVFGALNGTFLDGIHSRTGLQVYDFMPLQLGGLTTSAAVPPLLALFYVVLGTLVVLGDNLAGGKVDPTTAQIQQRSQGVEWVALCFGVLAAELQLSAWAFSEGKPFSEIFMMLASVSAVSWFLLDGTKQGLVLAFVCCLGAPAAELILLHFAPLWHYPSADVLDGAFVSWVPWCYFFYTPAISALARYLWFTASLPVSRPDDVRRW